MGAAARIFDGSRAGLLAVRGSDRHSFLHNFCTNDIKSLEAGDRCEAFIPDVTGHLVGHVCVIADTESLWLQTVGSPVTGLIEHFSHYVISEDVTFEDVGDSRRRWLVYSEEEETVEACVEAMSCCEKHAGPVQSFGWFLDSVRLIVASGESAGELVPAAVAAGAQVGTSDELEAWRIAALLPIHGQDISKENLAQEVDRTERAISFTKGCYLGQETIARIDSRGHVNRLLRGLQFSGGPLPVIGSLVRDAAGGDEVGRISSVVPIDDQSGRPQALSILKRNVAIAGTEVFVETGGGEVPASVVSSGSRGDGC